MSIISYSMPLLPDYIEPDDWIKNVLRKRAQVMTKLSYSILERAISRFEYGFALMHETRKAVQCVLKRELRHSIYGFILLEEISDEQLKISLVCLDERYNGAGDELMNAVLKFAKDNDYQSIYLDSEPEKSDWCSGYGFRSIDKVLDRRTGEVKAVTMLAKVNHEI